MDEVSIKTTESKSSNLTENTNYTTHDKSDAFIWKNTKKCENSNTDLFDDRNILIYLDEIYEDFLYSNKNDDINDEISVNEFSTSQKHLDVLHASQNEKNANNMGNYNDNLDKVSNEEKLEIVKIICKVPTQRKTRKNLNFLPKISNKERLKLKLICENLVTKSLLTSILLIDLLMSDKTKTEQKIYKRLLKRFYPEKLKLNHFDSLRQSIEINNGFGYRLHKNNYESKQKYMQNEFQQELLEDDYIHLALKSCYSTDDLDVLRQPTVRRCGDLMRYKSLLKGNILTNNLLEKSRIFYFKELILKGNILKNNCTVVRTNSFYSNFSCNLDNKKLDDHITDKISIEERNTTSKKLLFKESTNSNNENLNNKSELKKRLHLNNQQQLSSKPDLFNNKQSFQSLASNTSVKSVASVKSNNKDDLMVNGKEGLATSGVPSSKYKFQTIISQDYISEEEKIRKFDEYQLFNTGTMLPGTKLSHRHCKNQMKELEKNEFKNYFSLKANDQINMKPHSFYPTSFNKLELVERLLNVKKISSLHNSDDFTLINKKNFKVLSIQKIERILRMKLFNKDRIADPLHVNTLIRKLFYKLWYYQKKKKWDMLKIIDELKATSLINKEANLSTKNITNQKILQAKQDMVEKIWDFLEGKDDVKKDITEKVHGINLDDEFEAPDSDISEEISGDDKLKDDIGKLTQEVILKKKILSRKIELEQKYSKRIIKEKELKILEEKELLIEKQREDEFLKRVEQNKICMKIENDRIRNKISSTLNRVKCRGFKILKMIDDEDLIKFKNELKVGAHDNQDHCLGLNFIFNKTFAFPLLCYGPKLKKNILIERKGKCVIIGKSFINNNEILCPNMENLSSNNKLSVTNKPLNELPSFMTYYYNMMNSLEENHIKNVIILTKNIINDSTKFMNESKDNNEEDDLLVLIERIIEDLQVNYDKLCSILKIPLEIKKTNLKVIDAKQMQSKKEIKVILEIIDNLIKKFKLQKYVDKILSTWNETEEVTANNTNTELLNENNDYCTSNFIYPFTRLKEAITEQNVVQLQKLYNPWFTFVETIYDLNENLKTFQRKISYKYINIDDAKLGEIENICIEDFLLMIDIILDKFKLMNNYINDLYNNLNYIKTNYDELKNETSSTSFSYLQMADSRLYSICVQIQDILIEKKYSEYITNFLNQLKLSLLNHDYSNRINLTKLLINLRKSQLKLHFIEAMIGQIPNISNTIIPIDSNSEIDNVSVVGFKKLMLNELSIYQTMEEPYDILRKWRRIYNIDVIDFIKMMQSSAIRDADLIDPDEYDMPLKDLLSINCDFHFLPLSLFDDEIYETKLPEEWLNSGLGADFKMYAVPAIAYIPQHREYKDGELYRLHTWDNVAVVGYSDKYFHVIPLSDPAREPIFLKRIYIAFKGEDPRISFVRIRNAIKMRNMFENKIRNYIFYQFYNAGATCDNWIYPVIFQNLSPKVESDWEVYTLINNYFYSSINRFLLLNKKHYLKKYRNNEFIIYNNVEQEKEKLFISIICEEYENYWKIVQINGENYNGLKWVYSVDKPQSEEELEQILMTEKMLKEENCRKIRIQLYKEKPDISRVITPIYNVEENKSIKTKRCNINVVVQIKNLRKIPKWKINDLEPKYFLMEKQTTDERMLDLEENQLLDYVNEKRREIETLWCINKKKNQFINKLKKDEIMKQVKIAYNEKYGKDLPTDPQKQIDFFLELENLLSYDIPVTTLLNTRDSGNLKNEEINPVTIESNNKIQEEIVENKNKTINANRLILKVLKKFSKQKRRVKRFKIIKSNKEEVMKEIVKIVYKLTESGDVENNPVKFEIRDKRPVIKSSKYYNELESRLNQTLNDLKKLENNKISGEIKSKLLNNVNKNKKEIKLEKIDQSSLSLDKYKIIMKSPNWKFYLLKVLKEIDDAPNKFSEVNESINKRVIILKNIATFLKEDIQERINKVIEKPIKKITENVRKENETITVEDLKQKEREEGLKKINEIRRKLNEYYADIFQSNLPPDIKKRILNFLQKTKEKNEEELNELENNLNEKQKVMNKSTVEAVATDNFSENTNEQVNKNDDVMDINDWKTIGKMNTNREKWSISELMNEIKRLKPVKFNNIDLNKHEINKLEIKNYYKYSFQLTEIQHDLQKFIKESKDENCWFTHDVRILHYDDLREQFKRSFLFTSKKGAEVLTCTRFLMCSWLDNIHLYNMSDVWYVTFKKFYDDNFNHLVMLENKLFREERTKMINFMKNIFTDDIIMGDFTLHQTNWNEYKASKMYRFLKFIKFQMEITIKEILLNSINEFVNVFNNMCSITYNLETNFVWNDNLNESPFQNIYIHPPIFYLQLYMIKSGPAYSDNENTFEDIILTVFFKAIEFVMEIDTIDSELLVNLLFPQDPDDGNFLSLPGFADEIIAVPTLKLMYAIRSAIKPLKAYKEKFKIYHEFWFMNVNNYVKLFSDEKHSPLEVKNEILTQEKLKNDVLTTIPFDMMIGPFNINLNAFRLALIERREQIIRGHLKAYTDRMILLFQEECEQYMEIFRNLCKKPENVEVMCEMHDWMSTLPTKTGLIHELVERHLKDTEDVLESANYCLKYTELETITETLRWPVKIKKKILKVLDSFSDLFSFFRTNHFNAETALETQIGNISSLISSIALEDDKTKVHIVGNKAKIIWSEIKDAQNKGQALNKRQQLFHLPVLPYFDTLIKLQKTFEPYKNLWSTATEWLTAYDIYLDNPLLSLNGDEIEQVVSESYKNISKCLYFFEEKPGCKALALEIKSMIEDFLPLVAVIHALINPGLKQRHLDQFFEVSGIKLHPKKTNRFGQLIKDGIMKYTNDLIEISENASKEYALEEALNKMNKAWEGVNLVLTAYKTSGTYIAKLSDEHSQLLDDHIALTQQLTFNPFKGHFEEALDLWFDKLNLCQTVIDEWMEVQKNWMYLEPIFGSPDIASQLPLETKRFMVVDRIWRRILRQALANAEVMKFCPDNRILDQFKNGKQLLELVLKGLAEYLEMKRLLFPRFFFLSDDELIEILAQARNPLAVQPHLRKCFENIQRVTFLTDLCITQMHSAEGECVDLIPSIYPTGNVEQWLGIVEKTMRNTLRETIALSLNKIKLEPRDVWVLNWPGQVVIAVSQTYWTAHVEHAIQFKALKRYFKNMIAQLDSLRNLLKVNLERVKKDILRDLIIIEVHARDVLEKLIKNKITNINEFDWISQLRYYWVETDLFIRVVNAEFKYGYEYLGNSGRLAITPLTDRCYLTLTGALHLKFGGAPAGPAGTGKTETTKDLAKAFAIQCVVFNCSDQLDYMAMGKFFKGLASSGAWACFDEFNRIDIEVLSVIAQQIMTIQKAQMVRAERFVFEGIELNLVSTCSVFITMNPGYAGRTELPDNLKALFRPVAMMVPDYTLIAEISLFSAGFLDARTSAGKITSTFKLSSEQLSSQDHYDFGMRAVKTVIVVASNLKRENPEMDERQIILRALKDVNVPKFLINDLKLFNGIVSDLFPRMIEEKVDYGELEFSIRNVIIEFGLEDVNDYVMKVIQLYETTVVRHGLMIVGPTGSGKTKCYEILKEACIRLKGELSPSGNPFEYVWTYVLNPKSITMGQLYGEFDLATHEWTDGILPSIIRIGAAAVEKDKYWYVFDGPVDAVWIENMNTVLDDNKKLCLTSGEIIKLTPHMNLIFEVADLAVASPATVSRCGMVYLEPSVLGLRPYLNCWIKRFPPLAKPHISKFLELIENFILPAINFLRNNMKEIIPSIDSALVMSCLRIIDCFMYPLTCPDGKPAPPLQALELVHFLISPWTMFSIIWSIGVTCDSSSRDKFSEWLRYKMNLFNESPLFPEEGSIYDYKLHDGGFTMRPESGDYVQPYWIHWMKGLPKYEVDADAKFFDIEVPTIDNVRNAELLGLLLSFNTNVMCVGATGTGKTMTVMSKLSRNMPKKFLFDFLVFSARTSSNQTQDVIDSKVDKRRKGVFGPPPNMKLIIFIDDFNMPAVEVYGAQPPIELIRQWMDFQGWYDRKNVGEWKKLVDINFVAAMGPPGGGRNAITARLMRHFHYIAFAEFSKETQAVIFGTIFFSWMKRTSISVFKYYEPILKATLNIFATIEEELLPTPAKTHYTFNLRDLSKIFQGILMAQPDKIGELSEMVKLWYHESCRVLQDRLINDTDRNWFDNLLREHIKADFNLEPNLMLSSDSIIFCDFYGGMDVRRLYERAVSEEELLNVLTKCLQKYNSLSKEPIKLVLFSDAISHICRISRIIRQPLGNALLLGMGGSGRQSLTILATFIAEYTCFQIKLTATYGNSEWRDDIKKLMIRAGLLGRESVFLFSDTQIKSESFLEDFNNILNSGDVPNIYQVEDLDKILTAMRDVATEAGLAPTKSNLFSCYLKKVQTNLHCVIAMSPIGEIFRSRLRQFPALVNCCTINWFSPWPDSALENVANQFLEESTEYIGNINDETKTGLVNTCKFIHKSAINYSTAFLEELSRHNYVTPTAYLELLACYSEMLKSKKTLIYEAMHRLKIGLDKLHSTAEDVKILQDDLERLQPELRTAQIEAENMVQEIARETSEVEAVKEVIAVEEQGAAEVAGEAKILADDAQADLALALPALNEAENALKSLNKGDISEVKSMKTPPPGVVLVLEAICIMKGIKPTRVLGEGGKRILDFSEGFKKMLADPNFLSSLMQYDKEKLNDEIIDKIRPYINNNNFRPEVVIKVSKACKTLCEWVHAMFKYYFIAKKVAPKKEALKQAEAKLFAVDTALAKLRAKMKKVQDGLDVLQNKLNATVSKKKELEEYAKQCSARLTRALNLVGGLSTEQIRWTHLLSEMNSNVEKLIGDLLISAGAVAYLTPFTDTYRKIMLNQWIDNMKLLNIPHNDQCDPTSILGDQVIIRNWQLQGLPRDSYSVENAVLMFASRRFPLIIDPQEQSNKWIKNMIKETQYVIAKMTDGDLMRKVEMAVSGGRSMLIENVSMNIDPSLDPVLLKRTFLRGNMLSIKIGDNIIPYNSAFRLYLTTKLSNPHYTPEVSTKVLIVNFSLVATGLQDQLLSQVVMEERPDLEEARSQIIISSARMKTELKEIEDKILYKLSTSVGSPVDDLDLIRTFNESKIISEDIRIKVSAAVTTQKEIDLTRLIYIPVAQRATILFFCVNDLSKVDPMYQYSLTWFMNIFANSMRNSEKSDDVEERIEIIKDYFTFSLYSNVCRSLFEKNKLQFAFLICVRIMLESSLISIEEWTFFLAGGSPKRDLDNPSPNWLNSRSYMDILSLEHLPIFIDFVNDFINNIDNFRYLIDSVEPHREKLPEPWDIKFNSFRRMIIIKCLRSDKITNFMQDFITENIGSRFIEPQTSDLSAMYKESSPATPLIFVLSTGTDPASDLFKFADKMRMGKRILSISLGQGQGPIAEKMFNLSMEQGNWVFFQNCHLAPSWMPRLEVLIENISVDQVHRDFRVWLTSTPSPQFPISILQNGSKMTIEPPRGIKANMIRAYLNQVPEFNDFINSSHEKVQIFKWLLFSLCLFHGVVIERRKFGPLGFNIPYEFTDGDLRICISQLHMFLLEYKQIPFKVLIYTAGQINYGGRVTDDWDRRCIMNILSDYYNSNVTSEKYVFDENNIYHQLGSESALSDYLEYFKTFPVNDTPDLFGLHSNADISYAQAETANSLEVLLSLQPRSKGFVSSSTDDIIINVAKMILDQVPKPYSNMNEIEEKYPVMYEESLNTVLLQEIIRFNKLLSAIHLSLTDLLKALGGLVVMSDALERMSISLATNAVPAIWASKAYPSLKPLGAWITDLQMRLKFIDTWIDKGIPISFWISGFYFPQAFLTGCLQNYARKHIVSIDTLGFNFEILKSQTVTKVDDGCVIFGLFLEGARWSTELLRLLESKPKELYTEMAPIWFTPEENHSKASNTYDCPVYKTLNRAGVLSTTGHSTNYVLCIEIPSYEEQKHWIKRGVALFCALDY